MKMIVCKILFRFLCLYYKLKFLKGIIFMLEFTLSFYKKVVKTLESLLILNFDLSEKIGKAVTK